MWLSQIEKWIFQLVVSNYLTPLRYCSWPIHGQWGGTLGGIKTGHTAYPFLGSGPGIGRST